MREIPLLSLAPPPVASSAVSKSEPSADYNIRIIGSLREYLLDHAGEATFAEALSAAELAPADFENGNHWISSKQLVAFLATVRAIFPTDAAFMEAAAYRMAQSYGAMRFVLLAASPALVFDLSARMYKLVSRVGHLKILSSNGTALHLRLTDAPGIDHLVCLVRGAQTASLPTLWGLPPATWHEDKCIARGDDSCDFHFRWLDSKHWLPVFIGAAIGILLTSLLASKASAPVLLWLSIPLLGAMIGFCYELRRAGLGNLKRNEELTEAIRVIATEESEARVEVMAINQRQRDWSRMLEEVAAERALAVQRIVERVDQLQSARETKILGFSHDLRNPLQIMGACANYLRDHADSVPDGLAVIGDLDLCISRMQRMTADLMQVATAQSSFMQLVPQRIEIGPLTDSLRRRLKALVHGRDVRASVFGTREAPEWIETDPLLFDRVIDNILGNAAKYTVRGSIVIEVDGTPGFLLIKISDTGRGIEPAALAKTFTPGGSDPSERANDSYGVGLSVVVQLLGQVGGRLEVMSKPEHGTTFWVYFPIDTAKLSVPPKPDAAFKVEKYGDLLNRVVTIRKKSA